MNSLLRYTDTWFLQLTTMRYRLRSLMITVALGPPALALAYWFLILPTVRLLSQDVIVLDITIREVLWFALLLILIGGIIMLAIYSSSQRNK